MQRSTPQAGLSPLHRLWRRLPVESRRAALARGATMLAPRRSSAPAEHDPSAGLIVAGEVLRASGLGEAARILLRALSAAGVPAWPRDVGLALAGEAGDAAPPPAATGAPGPSTPLLCLANPPLLALALLRLGRRAAAGRRIGYWFWELPVAPPAWRRPARLVHEVWAPSRFTAAALEPLHPGRVRLVPLPLAACPPVAAPLGRAAFDLADGVVVVLVSFSLASSFARKNPLAAVAAFRQAFGARRDRLLLLKIGQSGHAIADMRAIVEAVDGAANIRIMTATLGEAERHAVTAACDIVLSLHRSEGFGLVPAEAMLLGRPVVATDWSGSTDFLDASCGMPVPYTLVPARDPRGVFEVAGADWAEADIPAAAASLARLADDAALRHRLGEAGRRAATRRLSDAPLLAALAGTPALGTACGC